MGKRIYTDEELINILQNFYNNNGRPPKEKEMKVSNGYPSLFTFITHFGGWNLALNAAGIKINKMWHKNISDDRCSICGTDNPTSNWNYMNGKLICGKCIGHTRYFIKGTLNPQCTSGIAVITEHIVSEVLKDCIKCNTKNNFCASHDLISKKYGTINVKAASLRHTKYTNTFWSFNKKNNTIISDNYVCIGFNEDRSNIEHVWIIPGLSNIVISSGITIANSHKGLFRIAKYEVNAEPYNEIYKKLNISTLSEFCNL